MKWRALVTFGALCVAAAVSTTAGDPQIVTTRDAGVLRVEAVVPGPVFDLAVHRDADLGNSLVLLVRSVDVTATPDDCDGATGPPSQLWRLTPPGSSGEAAGKLVRMRDDVDPRARTIQSFDLDGSGSETVVTVTPGELSGWPADGGEAVRLLADRDLEPRAATLLRTSSPPRNVLMLVGLGRARFLRPDSGDHAWRELFEVELPKSVSSRRHGLRLDSDPPVAIGEAGGALHFATAPAALSGRRLRGHWVAVAGDDVKHHEWWAGLPETEEVLEHAFVIFAGRPALLVTTRPSDKLGLFGEKRLRLFRLDADRSRMGHPPFFAVQSRINLWQAIVPYVRDVDGDGAEDLILAYWKGLSDDRVVLDVYRGRADGTLARNPRTTAFDVKDADRTFVDFGSDLDGDGVADLLLRTRNRLLVFAGNTAEGGRSLVSPEPSYEVTLSAGAREPGDEAEIVINVSGDGVQTAEAVGGPPRPRTVDIDGDGRHEVVTYAPLADGRLRLTLLRFGPE